MPTTYGIVDALQEYYQIRSMLHRVWERYPLVDYTEYDDNTDNLWGGDLDDDGLWGGDLQIETETIADDESEPRETKQIRMFLSDRGGIWARNLGYEVFRDLLCITPATRIEEASIDPRKGDYITVGQNSYVVREVKPFGFWKDTGQFFYITMSCDLSGFFQTKGDE